MRVSRNAALVAAVFVVTLPHIAAGQTVFLSGDSNLGAALYGTELFAPIDPGNKTFFENILQGGSNVVILNDYVSGLLNSMNPIDTFYNNLPGVSSCFSGGAVTADMLAGADLFIASAPGDFFTPGEIAAMSDFLAGGGSILFMGENGGFFAQNDHINDALAALGIGMSIVNSLVDPGVHTITPPRIVNDPFNTGVASFTYAAPSVINLGSRGKLLLLASNSSPFVAYVTIPEPGTWCLAIGVLPDSPRGGGLVDAVAKYSPDFTAA